MLLAANASKQSRNMMNRYKAEWRHMIIRRAAPEEAEQCWSIRNLSIREGCKSSYHTAVLEAWTPAAMPENYRTVITENPFFVVEMPDAGLVATGYLDLLSASVEAIFTLPDYVGRWLAGLVIETIKREALKRGIKKLTLSSTPNAQRFYEKHGFAFIKESRYASKLAQTDLRCIDMSIEL